MHNQFVTPFWRNAYESLPAHVRARYQEDFIAAERWELSVGALIEVWCRLGAAVRSLFHAPRAGHGH